MPLHKTMEWGESLPKPTNELFGNDGDLAEEVSRVRVYRRGKKINYKEWVQQIYEEEL